MTLPDCLRFLIGDAAAIRRIAACRSAIWVGLVFVLMAALAREYDQEDLVHEPWRLLVSPAASLGVATLLFLCIWWIGSGARREQAFKAALRRFVALFWLTGPLAWIYAVPYERFLEPHQAASANLWTLALVAAWRVVLIIRVVSVVHDVDFGRAAAPVLLLADVVAVVLVHFLPFPIIVVMGGVQDPAREVVRSTACYTLALGIVTLPIWIWATVRTRISAQKQGGWHDGPTSDAGLGVHASVWLFAAALVAAAAPAVGTAQLHQLEQARVRQERLDLVMAAIDALERYAPDGVLHPEDAQQQLLRDRIVVAVQALDRDAIKRMSPAEAGRILRSLLSQSGLGERVKATLEAFRDARNDRFGLDQNMRDEWARIFHDR